MSIRRAARWLASSRRPWWAVAIGALLTLPVLRVGFFLDDLLHRVVLAHRAPGYELAPYALYDFTTGDPERVSRLMEQGPFPWFTDPALAIRFFRPLSSLLLALDRVLFGDDALPAHLHSLVWLVLACAGAALLYRRVLPRTSATIASLIYACAGAHLMPTAFLAARHTVVATAFAALAVWAHVRWRNGWRPGVALSCVSFAAALCASETALGTAAFIVLYELIVRRGRMPTRVVRALPCTAIAIAYLAFYALAGYGTRHSGNYISPFDDPAAFARAAVERFPLLLGELYGGLSTDLVAQIHALEAPAAIWGALALGGVFLLAYVPVTRARRRTIVWLCLSSLACVLPVVGGVLGSRVLPLALVASAGVVASAIVESCRRIGKRRVLAIAVWLLVILHLGFPALMRASGGGLVAQLSIDERRVVERADLRACPEHADAYVLTGADPLVSFTLPSAFLFYTPRTAARFARLRVLSMAPHDQELTMLDARTFELRVLTADRVPGFFETIFRADPLEVGHRVTMTELTATVLETRHGQPMRVRFERTAGPESMCFLVWRDHRLRALRPPSPGEPLALPHELGPLGY